MTIRRLLCCLFLLATSHTLFAQEDASFPLPDGTTLQIRFYADNIVRIFHDPSGGPIRDPEAIPPAIILADGADRHPASVKVTDHSAATGRIRVAVKDGRLEIFDGSRSILRQTGAIRHTDDTTEIRFLGQAGARYYGGGTQNGRFSHGGKTIAIENQNSWTDGGVASPAPWFWTTAGYGILWHTFSRGRYTFGDEVVLLHETPLLDLFVMVDAAPVALLRDYYQLTGAPVLLPKFGFYEGHLNAYNRDYWKETSEPGKGVPFEDGKRYVESQKDNGGIRESLNGELPGNYLFSARAVVDRYAAADLPLGWILPNDGYGAGYGQAATLDGNIENLKSFGDYARSKGVEIGLWTQSDLHPVDSLPPLLQRDIEKEVGVAGVRVLKTDVAWVGDGYSFGLNGIADAAAIMEPHARPFIITLDGWAGTQRYAGIWTGDQTGGQWEYIRFHIPTYIGTGLSGQPNVGSDMDGIFGGRNEAVNIRDFQWKTFTPLQLNMDGWGSNEKYPTALGARASDINRKYLKLKSELMPYTYSIAREAVDGLPMVRAVSLAYPDADDFLTRYEFLYGPWFLVAPVYRETAPDADGNDVRDNIWLPEGEWIDFFTERLYTGGVILNHFDAPLDKLPVFVRRGAILPMTTPHNNPSQQDLSRRIYAVYPLGRTAFTEYDDDGRTTAWQRGECATTQIRCKQRGGRVIVTVHPTTGTFEGMVNRRSTEIRIHTAKAPRKVIATVNGERVEATTAYADGVLTVLFPETDITASTLQVKMKGFDPGKPVLVPARKLSGHSSRPEAVTTATSVELIWDSPAPEGSWREIAFAGNTYTHLCGTRFTFEDLQPDTDYTFHFHDRDGQWDTLTLHTQRDPYENAIKGIQARCSAPSQPHQEIENLFDGSIETEIWHTDWGKEAVPFDIEADLGAVFKLDKMEYAPRSDAGNGTLYRGSVSTSLDGKAWSEPMDFQWERDPQPKVLLFNGKEAQFVRLHVDAGIRRFGSGRELFIFKIPGTDGYKRGVFNEKGEAVEKMD
ncbi:MAG: DUF5110 domain-containing protein [Bacteroidales bacterium]|nr:DUF5110 domain-containing protein [Bacteroidales bacterium]